MKADTAALIAPALNGPTGDDARDELIGPQ